MKLNSLWSASAFLIWSWVSPEMFFPAGFGHKLLFVRGAVPHFGEYTNSLILRALENQRTRAKCRWLLCGCFTAAKCLSCRARQMLESLWPTCWCPRSRNLPGQGNPSNPISMLQSWWKKFAGAQSVLQRQDSACIECRGMTQGQSQCVSW